MGHRKQQSIGVGLFIVACLLPGCTGVVGISSNHGEGPGSVSTSGTGGSSPSPNGSSRTAPPGSTPDPGNGEAYSGNRPREGFYYAVDSRFHCVSNNIAGYRGLIEVKSSGQLIYRDACSSGQSLLASSEVKVSALGGPAFPTENPLLAYNGMQFDMMPSAPTAATTDRVSTRAWIQFFGPGAPYEVYVRARGNAENPVEATALLVDARVNPRILATTPVVGSTLSKGNVRTYEGDRFSLTIEKTPTLVKADLNTSATGSSLVLSTPNGAQDTVLLPSEDGPTYTNLDRTRFAAGSGFSCGTNAGAAYCWGLGTNGQLGDGAATNSSLPVPVSGLGSKVSQLSAGNGLACAVKDEKVYCWGKNTSGQVGLGFSSPTPQKTPALVALPVGEANGVSAGNTHACGLIRNSAYCWGENNFGELGGGTIGISSPTPIPVQGISTTISSIAVALRHTCALTSQGDVYCWGDNSHGQLGTGGATTPTTVPQKISNLKLVLLRTGEDHSCGLTQMGKMVCWGLNPDYINSAGVRGPQYLRTPTETSVQATSVSDVATGVLHTCAISKGNILCWGRNINGELGGGSPVADSVSGFGMGADEPVSIAVARFSNLNGGHTLLRTSTGAKVWGANDKGQLGIGNLIDKFNPFNFVFP